MLSAREIDSLGEIRGRMSQKHMKDLDRIAVTIGPGTFTGLRIGLSFARALSLARSIPAIGLDTLHAFRLCTDEKRALVLSVGQSNFAYLLRPGSDDIELVPILELENQPPLTGFPDLKRLATWASVQPVQLAEVLCPIDAGGLLSRVGVVDYSIGKGVAPGVFVVTKAPHERIHERMVDLKVGKGPYFRFLRPYHLTSLEVPLSCARAVLYGAADMVPHPRPTSEVCALAKRDLKVGDALDAIGEYTYRAWIMTVGDAQAANAVPCGLLEGGKVTKPIKKGELITISNVSVDTKSRIYELRQLQDQMLKAAH